MSLRRIASLPRPLRFALGLVVGAILLVTLYPAEVVERLPPWWCVACGDRGGADFLLNVILFLPLGLLLRLAGTRGRTALLTGMLLSLTIELTQAFIPGRDTSLGDVIANTSGAVLGFILAAGILATARRKGPGTVPAALGALAALAVVAATGVALLPSLPPSTYFGQWTPDLDGGLDWYRGRVLRATLGAVPVPSRQLEDQEQVHNLLRAGAPVDVTALAGPPPGRIAPLFSIYDDLEREILMIAPRRNDLVIRYRTASLAWGLDRPYATLPGALSGVRAGDTLRVTLWRERGRLCVTVNGRRDCDLGFSAGAGWSVFIYPERFSAALRALLGAVWVGGLLLPAGFLARSRNALGGVAVAAAVGLAVVPGAVGLQATTPLEWAGAAAGIAAGVWLRALAARLVLPQPGGAGRRPQAAATSASRQRSIRS